MIVIHTPTGTHEFPGEHEVTNNGGTLKLTARGKTVGVFREWSYWKEIADRPAGRPRKQVIQ